MNEFFKYIPEIIKESSKSPLGVICLVVILLFLFAIYFLKYRKTNNQPIPSGDYDVFRKSNNSEQKHERLKVEINGKSMNVTSPEWGSVGQLKGGKYIGRFKYTRGNSGDDTGTHELVWNGHEFVGGVCYDNGTWKANNIIWRPL